MIYTIVEYRGFTIEVECSDIGYSTLITQDGKQILTKSGAISPDLAVIAAKEWIDGKGGQDA